MAYGKEGHKMKKFRVYTFDSKRNKQSEAQVFTNENLAMVEFDRLCKLHDARFVIPSIIVDGWESLEGDVSVFFEVIEE